VTVGKVAEVSQSRRHCPGCGPRLVAVGAPPSPSCCPGSRSAMSSSVKVRNSTRRRDDIAPPNALHSPFHPAPLMTTLGREFASPVGEPPCGCPVSPTDRERGSPMTTCSHLDGKQTGPHTEEELNRLWLAGEIPLHASYWRPGMSEWMPIGKLFDIPSPPSSPRPRERGADGGSGRPRRVWYHDRNDTFHGTLQQVMRRAVRAIQDLGYKVDSANESVGIVTFQTGITWGSWSGEAEPLRGATACHRLR
jgi:hypothetical protein